MVDDSHATGFMGATGRGTPEHCGVARRVDILTGTLGKALGGGSGGYIAARKRSHRVAAPALAAVSVLQQHPAGGRRVPACAVLDLLEDSPELRDAAVRRTRATSAPASSAPASTSKPGEHPIIPVMLGDAALAGRMAERLLERGVYVIGFSFPVVPKGQARIRTQMSAALTREQLDRAHRGVHDGRPRAGRRQ